MFSKLSIFITGLLIVSYLSSAFGQEGVRIGNLSTLFHEVSGTVFAVDSKTLRIDNFRYDGEGPATVYWINTGSAATPDGIPALTQETCKVDNPLPAFDGTQSVTIELPNDLTLSDIGYFSIWCTAFVAEFGGIAIDASSLQDVPEANFAKCSEPTPSLEEDIDIFPVSDGWNCEPLSDSYQVRWLVSGDDLNVELVAKDAGVGKYMGFGVSGSNNSTQPLGSDVAIAYTDGDDFKVVDYSITASSSCVAGEGICPDTVISPNPGNNDITNISGDMVGDYIMVRYTRPLAAADSVVDRAISTDEPTFVVWSVGPFNETTELPMFPTGNLPFSGGNNLMFSFDRMAVNNCPAVMA